MKIAVVANTSWYIFNFRRNLISALREAGHDVVAIAPEDDYFHALNREGVQVLPIPLDVAGTNPLRELRSVVGLRQVLQRENIELVLSYTPKGNLYTAMSSMGLPLRQIANVSGLGRAFVRGGWLNRFARLLYRVAFRRAIWVFFQNDDDRRFFVSEGLIDARKSERIPGSGVDLARFATVPLPASCAPESSDSHVTFLLVARMLWDKGVGDFVEAARQVRAQRPSARFRLLGFLDPGHPSGISRETMQAWEQEGVIEYLGATDDIRPAIGQADCVVLPSYYREGVPRSLLEAAAMGRPLIATDSIGCRDAVTDQVTGFLVPPKSVADLTRRLVDIIDMAASDRSEMGRRGRKKMELEFAEQIVIQRYLNVVSTLVPSGA